jgi:anthranilate 1,2-dioxygenase large subunit
MATAMSLEWPVDDFTRIPFAAYHDDEVYVEEQERIFRGPTWCYLGLEAEIPNAGDFVTTLVGDTPILLNRQHDGAVSAFINRCMHRGTLLERECRGNASMHTCLYHQWSYDLGGQLRAIPFMRGHNGEGGMPADFEPSSISLDSMHVDVYNGVIFGSFSDSVEPLVDYLGPTVRADIDRIFNRPIKLLGYQRQRIFGNWKLYNDNVRDPNHGALLHMFHATFGLYRPTQTGGIRMDERHRHSTSYSAMGTSDDEDDAKAFADTKKVFDEGFHLRDESMLQYVKEYPDDVSLIILSVFPNLVVQQITNSLCTRQIQTVGPGELELYWTYFGYEDDDEEMTRHRLNQANLVGPGGLISMEDGEAVELVQRAVLREQDQHAFVEIGGKGDIVDQEYLVTEMPIRGFWSYYYELMGIEPAAEAG